MHHMCGLLMAEFCQECVKIILGMVYSPLNIYVSILYWIISSKTSSCFESEIISHLCRFWSLTLSITSVSFSQTICPLYKLYAPCTNTIPHVQTLYPLYKLYNSHSVCHAATKTIGNPQLFTNKLYASCTNSIPHVQTLYPMYKHYIPCTN